MNIEQWYKSLPPVTRVYMTGCLLATLLCTFDVLNPLHLILNIHAIKHKYEFWRIITNFFYLDNIGIGFFFHMHFVYVYFNRLEEEHFHRNSADFFMMLVFGAVAMLLVAPFIPNMHLLSYPLVFMVLYVWSRKNPRVQMAFWGLFTFTAPYLPWVLLAFSLMLGGWANVTVDLLGIFIGHIYFFLSDVYPVMTGHHVIRTPRPVSWLFEMIGAQRPAEQQQQARFIGGQRVFVDNDRRMR
jgi:Derlin-2/3